MNVDRHKRVESGPSPQPCCCRSIGTLTAARWCCDVPDTDKSCAEAAGSHVAVDCSTGHSENAIVSSLRRVFGCLLWVVNVLLMMAGVSGCSAIHQPYTRTIEHKMEVLNRIPRSDYKPVDLRLLSQTPPPEHLVDDGDILGVYIEGAPGQDGGEMPVRFADDRFVAPAIGFPIPVRAGGYVRVPQIGVMHVRGMTVGEIEDRIRHILTVERGELQPEMARIHVSLMWKRSVNVLVVRQEEVSSTQLMSPSNGTDADRRSGEVIELPAFQNDVLHALMHTGGLPNGQAENAVYVFKRHDRLRTGPSGLAGLEGSSNSSSFGQSDDLTSLYAQYSQRLRSGRKPIDMPHDRSETFPRPSAIQLAAFSQVVNDTDGQRSSRAGNSTPLRPVAGHSMLMPVPESVPVGNSGMVQQVSGVAANGGLQLPGVVMQNTGSRNVNPDSRHPNAVRIPLTAPEGQALGFTPNDVILEDGDIILVESREQDHFFTGGLLGGGQYALPRNYDLDVVDAVLLADSYSRSTQLNSPTRAIGGVSVLNRDVTIGASRVIIERTDAQGNKRRFRISLYAAMRNPDQRVIIEPGDRLYLEYTSAEAFFAFIERHMLDPFMSAAPTILTD